MRNEAMMKITPIKIQSEERPTDDQFLAAGRAEYMRRCEIIDELQKMFDESILVGFFDDGPFIIQDANKL